MRDLCQGCRNFCICPLGEGKSIDPKIRQEEVVADSGEPMEVWEVVECDLFWEYPRKSKQIGGLQKAKETIEKVVDYLFEQDIK